MAEIKVHIDSDNAAMIEDSSDIARILRELADDIEEAGGYAPDAGYDRVLKDVNGGTVGTARVRLGETGTTAPGVDSHRITFGDGAHGSMVDILENAARGNWVVELLDDGQNPGEGQLIQLTGVTGEALIGVRFKPDGTTGAAISRSLITETFTIHIY
ncbi:MAG: hypothetical protein ABWZ30_00955 [Jiangellaceae bacterium]